MLSHSFRKLRPAQSLSGEILFVDDHSTDGTRDRIRALAERYSIRLIEQDRREPGLAAAIMSGARAARGEILLEMDADLSHPPQRTKDLVAPLQTGTADMVVGSRYIKGGSTPGWPLWRRSMSRVAAALAYPLTGVHDSRWAVSLLFRVRGCWRWRHTRAGSKLFSRRLCAATGRCACVKFPSHFAIVYGVSRKCRSALRCDFRFDGCARCSVISHMDDLVLHKMQVRP